MFRYDGIVRLAALSVLLSAPLAGCSMFSSSTDETAAEQTRRIQAEVGTAVAPLRKEVDGLRQTTEDNTREIGVLKTEVEVIKQDASRRPLITPSEHSGGGGPAPETGGGERSAAASPDDEAERLRRQQALEERIARETGETDRLVQERVEMERRRKEQAAREAQAGADRQAQEEADRKAARERVDRELAARKTEEDRLAGEESDRKAAQERVNREVADRKAEADRLAREKLAAEAKAAAATSGQGKDEPGSRTPGGLSTAKAAPGAAVVIPPDASPEERATLLTNALRTTSDVESVARQMRDVSAIVAPALMRMLSDTDITAKFRAEKALSFLDPKVVAAPLIDALKKPQSQLATIKILGNLGDPVAVPSLTGFLSHKSLDLRFYAADSLVKLKEKKAIPALIDYLKGSDTAKSAIAYDTLRQKTGQNLPFPFFGSKEEREKYAAAWEQWWKEKGDRFEFK